MRLVKRSPWLVGLGMLLVGVVLAPGARANVTTDQSGSLVIYPKVVSDGTRDTLIQLSNGSNMPVCAHCFYVNTMGTCSIANTQSCRRNSDCPTGETCVRACNAQNFDVTLTPQQPIQWRVSTGRLARLSFPPCRPGQTCACTLDQSGQLVCPGLLPGENEPFVPPVGTDFEGELKCYQLDGDTCDTPMPGNALKGTATIETISNGQISEYNAISIAAQNNNGNEELLLDGNEYNACPQSVVFVAPGEGTTDAFTGATVSTEITLVSCTELFEEREPAPVTVGFVGYNEMEQSLSVEGFRFDCFFSGRLAELPGNVFSASLGKLWKIRVTPSSSNVCLTGRSINPDGTCASDADCEGFVIRPGGTSLGCRPSPGVIGVAEQFYTVSSVDGAAAYNLHQEGARDFDIITVPRLTIPDPSASP